MSATTVKDIDPSLLEGENPFAGRIVDEPWSSPADAPSIHGRAGDDLFKLVGETRADGRSRLAIVTGESGAGKSHLLGRLRQRLGAGAFFIFIDPFVSRERLFRHVVLRLVDSLWRPDADGSRPLERYMDEVLLKTLDTFVEGDPGPLDEVCRRFEADVRSGALYRDPDRSVHVPRFIEQVLGDPARLAGPDALVALGATRRAELAPLALDWLRGHDLDPADLDQLGVRAPPTGDDQARRTISALAALIEGKGPLVLSFDQTESLPSDERGRPELAFLLDALAALRADARNLVVVVTCLGEVLREVGGTVESDLRAPIRGLDPAAARALVTARVADRLAAGAAFQPGYPFGDAFYAGLGDRATARDVLSAAAREIDRLRRQSPGAAAAAPPDPDAHWRAVFRDHERLAVSDPVATDEILVWSIRTVLEWRAAAGGAALVAPPEGVSAAWRGAPGVVGAAVSSTRDGGSFLGHVRALLTALTSGKVNRLLLVRRGEISSHWSAAPFLLESYGRGGGLLCGLDPTSERLLRTVRHLRLASEAGDARRPDGTPARPEEVAAGVARAGLLSSVPLIQLAERSLGG